MAWVAGYIPRWYARQKTVTHPSTNRPTVRRPGSNSRPLSRKTVALTTRLPRHLRLCPLQMQIDYKHLSLAYKVLTATHFRFCIISSLFISSRHSLLISFYRFSTTNITSHESPLSICITFVCGTSSRIHYVSLIAVSRLLTHLSRYIVFSVDSSLSPFITPSLLHFLL